MLDNRVIVNNALETIRKSFLAHIHSFIVAIAVFAVDEALLGQADAVLSADGIAPAALCPGGVVDDDFTRPGVLLSVTILEGW